MVHINIKVCVSEVLQPISFAFAVCVHSELEIKVKQSLYSPEHARSVPGGGSCQILCRSAMIVVGLPAVGTGYSYSSGNIPGTHLCKGLNRLKDHNVAGKIMSTKRSSAPIGKETREFRPAQYLNQFASKLHR
jgi:hypothetical protein